MFSQYIVTFPLVTVRMMYVNLIENKGWSAKTKEIPMLPWWKTVTNRFFTHSFIHSIFIYWRLAIWIRQKKKIRQKVLILYQNNTVSNKYKDKKKADEIYFGRLQQNTPGKRLLTSISADSTRFSIISIHCLLAGGSSLITVSSAMSVAGTVNTKMKKFTHYFIFR